MSLSRIASLFTVSFTLLLSGIQDAQADAIFDFETNAQNTHTPFTDTVNGISATFGGLASVCDSTGLFQSLSGKVLIQNLCGSSTEAGPLTVSFSSSLTSISFNFAISGGPGTLAFSAFQGATSIGTANFSATLPPGRFNGEGLASFSGTFDSIRLTPESLLALDNINAITSPVPEPASLATVAASVGLLAAFARKRKR